jgi:lipopolysaccharide export system protein LptA
MKSLIRLTAVFFLLGELTLSFSPGSGAVKDLVKDTGEPIVIRSDTLEVIGSSNTISFKGKVTAKGSGFEMKCDEMLVFYTKGAAKGLEKENPEGGIDRIVATGSVKVVRTEGGFATADKAEFFQKDEKVILTGNPVLTQERDSVEGDRITVYLKENRIVVDGASEKKVKATIFPKGKDVKGTK